MTTIDERVGIETPMTATGATAVGRDRAGALGAVGDWLTTTDHKRIGRLYVAAAAVVLVGVAVIAVLLGVERISAGDDVLDADALPQLFGAYRVLLTFGVVVPLMLGVCVAVVPLQLGARAIAFGRLAMTGFWTWLVGAALVVVAIAANGGPSGGDDQMVELFLAAHVLVVLGLLATALSVATSVLTTRAPGMHMRRVPPFAWSALVFALGLLLALPVLVGVLVLLFVDHRYGGSAFGGDTALGGWIGAAFTQPATVLYAVPVFGLLLDSAATATRRRLPLRGVGLIGIGLTGTAFLAGVAQVDITLPRDLVDMTTEDAVADLVPYALLHALPLLGALVVLAVFLRSLLLRPRVVSPLVFSFLGAGMVFVGIAGNAVHHVGDAQLVGTVFEEGAWIYVCYGAVLGGMGAVAHWAPKLWGRRLADGALVGVALLGVLATVLASFPYYIAGFADQPAGVTLFDDDGAIPLWNTLATVGHGLMLLTVVAFAGLLFLGARRGDAAGDDPWDGQTLEWATSSPPPHDNFAELHTVASAEPLLDLKPSHTAGATEVSV